MTATTDRINTWRFVMSAAITGAVVYLACVVWDLVFAQWAMHEAWQDYLPGFRWLTFGSFVLGLVETFIMVGLIAWVFVVTYNVLGRGRT